MSEIGELYCFSIEIKKFEFIVFNLYESFTFGVVYYF